MSFESSDVNYTMESLIPECLVWLGLTAALTLKKTDFRSSFSRSEQPLEYVQCEKEYAIRLVAVHPITYE